MLENESTKFSFKDNNFLKNFCESLNSFSKLVMDTIPSMNFFEETESYKVEISVPGMHKSDFKIDIEAGFVTISCNKKTEPRLGNFLKSRKEFDYSSFTRSFMCPDDANTNKISAKYTDGILCLNIPKLSKEEKEKSKINVE